MASKHISFDPFLVATTLGLLATGYIFYDSFLNRNFTIFTSEEQIEETIQAEFPLLADYLL